MEDSPHGLVRRGDLYETGCHLPAIRVLRSSLAESRRDMLGRIMF